MSLHPEDTYDVLAINAASLSTQISGLPFSGPVAGVRIAFIDGQWVAFPRYSDRARATCDMVVAGRVVGDDAAGDDHVEGGPGTLGVAREGDPLAVDERDAHARDRAGERQAGDLGGEGGGVDRQDVVGVLGVQRHHRDDDLDLVAQTLDEQGTQRAVDQPAGQDPLGGRPTLAAEERARDLADGVLPLLDVHREGEEVELVLRGLADRGGRQQGRVLVEVGDDGAAGLAGQTAGLESDGTGAEAAIVDDGLGGLDLGSLHGDALLRRSTRPLAAVFDRGPRIEVRGTRSASHYRRPGTGSGRVSGWSCDGRAGTRPAPDTRPARARELSLIHI